MVIDTSTSYPPQVVAAAARLGTAGVHLLDAPVSGGRAGAEAASLWANSTVMGVKAPQIMARAFDKPIGTVAVQRKDLHYINRSMADLGIELPFSPQLMVRGHAALDQIALVHLFEERAGLTIEPKPTAP